MAKLTLVASPTFKHHVSIPVPGGKPASVEFTFKARSKTDFKEFVGAMGDREDIDVIMDLASGWDLAEPFDRENVEKMTELYIGSAMAIIETYVRECTGARAKN